jgi:hypothetical protein
VPKNRSIDSKKTDAELTADDLQSLEMLLGLMARLVHLSTTAGNHSSRALV